MAIENWVRIASTHEIPEDEMIGIVIERRAIGVYNLAGRFHAVEDICPHAWVRLSNGLFDGRTIECPIHAARFSVASGRRLSGPVCRDLLVYPVRVDGDDIFVDLERIPISIGL
jgi:nitrite reductase/ring-hydroxylating ferredoxin subunit